LLINILKGIKKPEINSGFNKLKFNGCVLS
jgi:hypothetical protein